MNDSTKVCRECKSEIRSDARKCPHCGSSNAPFYRYASFYIVLVSYGILFCVLLSTLFSSPLRAERPHYADYPDALTIVNASFTIQSNFVTTLGTIRNNTDVPWTELALQADFYDAEGNLIDSISEKAFDITVPPHTEQAFRIHELAARPAEEYASQKVFVRWATAERR